MREYLLFLLYNVHFRHRCRFARIIALNMRKRHDLIHGIIAVNELTPRSILFVKERRIAMADKELARR
jgi:predicted AlkP superfamily pyrophosphatase or phosphodiesterase